MNQKKLNRLLKEVNRYYSVKEWQICTQNFNFLILKTLSPGQFLGATAHADINEFSNFLLELKNHRSGCKIVSEFSVILILKGIITF